MDRKVNTLVLGGNGFVGSHLVDRLLEQGHAVRVLDKYPETFRQPLSGIEYCQGDFGNRGLVAEALDDIDVVFHLISTTLPKTSNDDPAFDIQSNLIDTIHLLEQCVTRRVKKVVFVSSGGTVYGPPQWLPVKENHPTEPVCSYGISKMAIEKYLALYLHLYGLDYAVVRLSNPYGERQNPRGIQGAIPVFMDRVLRNETIEIWGDGSVIRDFIYIRDVVEAMTLAACSNTGQKIFNIGSGAGLSLNDLIAAIGKTCETTPSVRYSPARTFDVPAIYLDISRAREELAWTPVTPLRVGLERTREFLAQQIAMRGA